MAAGTGAAQLGLGYGLGVVVWPTGVTTDPSVWQSSLGWATWTAASATVFGAVVAGRLGRAAGGPWRFALAASAAVGALLTVALIALPARGSVRVDTFSPETVAGGYAVIGVLLGLVLAYWAVVSYPAATNLIATACWLWALAVAAVVVDVFWHRPTATYLSSWQFVTADGGGTIHWREALLTLLAAFVLGVVGAWPAARRGNLGVGAAASGAVGPLLVAAAFFGLAPQFTTALGPLGSAYLTAPYAVLAGLAGSAATIALAQQRATRRATRAAAAGTAGIPAQRPSLTAGRSTARPAKAGTSAGSAQTAASPQSERVDSSSQSRRPGAAPQSGRTGASPQSGRTEENQKVTATEVAGPPAEREKPSLLRRLRRGGNDAKRDPQRPAGDSTSVATGRAQAPAAARSSPQASPPSPVPSSAAAPSAAQTSAAAPSPAQRSAAAGRETVARPPASPDIARINPPTADGATPSASGTAPSAAEDTPPPAAGAKQTAASPAKSAPAAKKAPAKRASAPKPASRSKPAPKDTPASDDPA
ncbi:hypothetical protein GCM10010166_13380 [Couchioplanes caeruleus subsp. azureus]|nr:hypothetical protein GCM10010166_13380 [Couchioplanes caeruleus subsp. azureus]